MEFTTKIVGKIKQINLFKMYSLKTSCRVVKNKSLKTWLFPKFDIVPFWCLAPPNIDNNIAMQIGNPRYFKHPYRESMRSADTSRVNLCSKY